MPDAAALRAALEAALLQAGQALEGLKMPDEWKAAFGGDTPDAKRAVAQAMARSAAASAWSTAASAERKAREAAENITLSPPSGPPAGASNAAGSGPMVTYMPPAGMPTLSLPQPTLQPPAPMMQPAPLLINPQMQGGPAPAGPPAGVELGQEKLVLQQLLASKQLNEAAWNAFRQYGESLGIRGGLRPDDAMKLTLEQARYILMLNAQPGMAPGQRPVYRRPYGRRY